MLKRLFGRNGELRAAADQIIEALLRCDSSAVLQWAERTRLREPLAAAIRDMSDALSHQALDDLPPSKSVEWLRNILIQGDVLPPRDRYLHRTEMFIKSRLLGIENPDDRSAVRAFTEWHHLRKLRAHARQTPLKRGNGQNAQRETVAVTAFLADLHEKGASLESCRQEHVDDWLVRNPTRPEVHQFLAWAVKRGYAHDITAPPPPDRRVRHTFAGEGERWELIQRLIGDPNLETQDRVAGLLVLLYSQQTSRLVALKVSDVTVDTNGAMTLKLGAAPVVLPQPVDRSVAELIEQRRGYAAVSAGDSPWLFPGGRSGQHLSPERLGARLRAIGIVPRLARNTALIELASELPAAVIAKLLGCSVKRAVAWNIEAGNTHPRYAATVARRSPGRARGKRSDGQYAAHNNISVIHTGKSPSKARKPWRSG